MRGPEPWNANRGRALRDRASIVEVKLWQSLRKSQLGGHKFSRQIPIGPYFADFVCREKNLVIEVDGATHSTDEERAADKQRTAEIEVLGYTVIRFTNTDIYENIDSVCDTILVALESPHD
ncbi:MAG: endonuclease domain-containing protein [Hyphomicrobiaceae bacterium]